MRKAESASPAIQLESRPHRVADVKEIDRDREVLLYFDKHRPGYILNRSARAVWDMCDGVRRVEDISRLLESELDLPEGALLVDVRQTVGSLAEARLLELEGDEAAPPVAEPATAEPATKDASGIDWASLARPRADGADLERALALFASRHGKARLKPFVLEGLPREHVTCGDVRVHACYRTKADRLPDAAFDHPNLAHAEEYLRRWPEGYRQFRLIVHSLHPLLHEDVPVELEPALRASICHSSDAPERLGAIYSTINCPFFLAENYVHETAHQKLFALGIRKESCDGLVTNSPAEGYRSPVITDRPRPMTALVHGVYAYMYVTAFDLAFLAAEPPGALRERVIERLGVNLSRLGQGAAEMRPHLRTDAEGAAFFRGFDAWLDELLETGSRVLQEGRAVRRKPEKPVAREVLSPVRVFVGTDPRQEKAEVALEHSIRAHTRGPVEIVWMDFGRGGPWAGWSIGRERGAITAGPSSGWLTEFTGYRFAIPEVAGFRGRAIYLDSDMLAVGDLRELFEQSMAKPWLATSNCPAAMLVDCAHFESKAWWPRLEALKASGWGLGEYVNLLKRHDAYGSLDERWNCHDGKGYAPGKTRIVHFTTRATQPWMPYPEVFRYSAHRDAEMEALWWEAFLAARAATRPASKQTEAAPPPSRTRPSAEYEPLVARHRALHREKGGDRRSWGGGLLRHARTIAALLADRPNAALLDYGSGKGFQYGERFDAEDPIGRDVRTASREISAGAASIPQAWGVPRPTCYDPAYPPYSSLPRGAFDGVVCTDVLDCCAAADVPWILEEIFAFARGFVFVALPRAARQATNGAHGSNGSNGSPATPSGDDAWWRAELERAAAAHPGIEWKLELYDA